jgi:FkbM family methyltransferase
MKIDVDTSLNYSNKYSKIYINYLFANLGKILIKPQQWKEQLSKFKTNLALFKLTKTKRYTQVHTNVFRKDFEVADSISFVWTYRDIFEKQIYKFKSDNQSPLIIDCGANIGLSVLYFKQLYPDSHIIAFEPDSKIFEILKKNVNNFGFHNIEIIKKAVWSSETVLEFISEGADAGRVAHSESEKNNYQVSTVRLRDYLDKSIDLLKIDIEGAEIEVIKDCYDLFFNVKNLFVEYHSFVDCPQHLDTLLKLLRESGFRIYIQETNSNTQPFLRRNINLGMDMLLNIFAFRE